MHELRKAYAGVNDARIEVLRGASFSVKAGEILAIMGASGAGKSTLLHLLGGLDQADAGAIQFSDFDIARAQVKQLARFRNQIVGFVFQFHHLLADLTALENVALPMLISRANCREAFGRAVVALERVRLAERAEDKITHLSGGEQQRVAVARALINCPQLVLADEPTGNLDAATGEEIGALLKNFAHDRRASVIIATHNEHLAEMCDRTLVLAGGTLKER